MPSNGGVALNMTQCISGITIHRISFFKVHGLADEVIQIYKHYKSLTCMQSV
jgi:hypothetical protein